MLVNYYYVCICKHWKEAGSPKPGLFKRKNPLQAGSSRGRNLTALLSVCLCAPLQALLTHCFMQRFFVAIDRAQPRCIVHLATRNRADFVERLRRTQCFGMRRDPLERLNYV